MIHNIIMADSKYHWLYSHRWNDRWTFKNFLKQHTQNRRSFRCSSPAIVTYISDSRSASGEASSEYRVFDNFLHRKLPHFCKPFKNAKCWLSKGKIHKKTVSVLLWDGSSKPTPVEKSAIKPLRWHVICFGSPSEAVIISELVKVWWCYSVELPI